MSAYIALLSFIYLIKSRILMNLGVAATEVSVCGRAAVVAKVETVVEASVSEDRLDRRRGERQSREWWRGDRRGHRFLG
jgi:hypothetical protein